MKLSIVIVNYNVEHFLEQCLQSVEDALIRFKDAFGVGQAEVFVVDNNSVDGSNAMVERKFLTVTLIKNTQNLGFSKANNQAMRMAQGTYILLLNPDTVVEPDTFVLVCRFMDEHPKAGGLGVKMLDGKGVFLPESKRGLPTPWVAFYKIFGLSALFPQSKRFGRYHLGYLSKDEVHEIEILSGAFMLMRKEALDKVGLLDEDYFMYGEDIDLSWRIIKGGYANYYFPHTRIIHYKGESTKKSSINYVFIFYRAMVIFARKHFSQKHAALFSFLIHFAIYLRAGIAIFQRFIKRIALPLADFSALLATLWFLKWYWETNHKYVEGGEYPALFSWVIIPAYVLVWLSSIFVSGGYDRPFQSGKLIRGIFWGTVMILVGYALLDERLRFSRALILLGGVSAVPVLIGTRMLTQWITERRLTWDTPLKKRVIIVGDEVEAERVEKLVQATGRVMDCMGWVTAEATQAHGKVLGNVSRLPEIMEVYKVDEVIFCAKSIPSNTIIEQMAQLQSPHLEFKIAPPESEFIIGSNSIHSSGEMYMVELNAINKPVNKRNKRVADLAISLVMLILWIPMALRIPKPFNWLRNIGAVLTGQKTWVGYALANPQAVQGLPVIKPGVLTPLDGVKFVQPDLHTIHRVNALYAKDYQTNYDVEHVLKNWRVWGR